MIPAKEFIDIPSLERLLSYVLSVSLNLVKASPKG